MLLFALVVILPLVFIPAEFGFSLDDGTISAKQLEADKEETEEGMFLVLEVYYLLFLFLNIYPYLVLVLWSTSSRVVDNLKRSKKEKVDERGPDLFGKKKFPDITILIPCYNEGMHIGNAVKSAFKQVYRGSIEIIVVDDGSMDNTYSIGRIFRMSTESRSVKIVHKNNGGKASALKTGIEKASGKILIMTDGDSGMDRNAVSNIVNTFRRYPDAAIVGGFVSVKNTHSGYLTVLQQLEYMITQHLIRTNQNDDGSVLIAPGPIFGIRGDIAKLYPPLDRTLVEDCDLTMSVLPSGYTTRSTHRSVSNTNAPETWRDWFRQRRRWIYGQFQAWRENKWHLRRNPWGLFTYFTWVSTSLSSMLLLGTLMVSASLIGYGSSYYALFEFISVRTFLIFSIYLLTRGLILLSYPQSRKYIHYLPLKVLYDLVNGFLTTYLYIRYITGTGVRMSWGHRSEVVH